MRLIIPQTKEYDEFFIEWLVNRIRVEILRSISLQKIKVYSVYQQEHKIFKPQGNNTKEIDFVKVMIKGANSFRYKKVKNNWIIYMREDIQYPGYFVNVYSLCKWVSYGVSDLKGYPLLPEILNTIQTKLKWYYTLFLSEYIL